MILIAAYSSDGCEGRCDSRCYNSRSRRCSCVCQSANHGVGLEKATLNTRAMAATWMSQFQVFDNAGEAADGDGQKAAKELHWEVPAFIPYQQQELPLSIGDGDAQERSAA